MRRRPLAWLAVLVVLLGVGAVAIAVWPRPETLRPPAASQPVAPESAASQPAEPEPAASRPVAPEPSWVPSGATPHPAQGAVALGSRVALRNRDVTSDVTLGQVEDPRPAPTPPPGPGARVVSVLVTIHNTGRRAYPPKAELYTWAGDTGGRWFAADFPRTDAVEPAPADDLAPGWTRDRVVVFEIPEDAELIRFRFALGLDDTAPADDWTLS